MSHLITFDCRHRYSSGFVLDLKFHSDAPLTAITGPSGSGKTTILALIAGLLRPERGRIEIQDDVLTSTSDGLFLPPERRHVGLLFQDQCLFPHLRVAANLKFGQQRRGSGKASFDQVVETLQLSDLLTRFPQTLSGGQQQRVALARAILSAPELLLLDEPSTSVEPNLRAQIGTLIRSVVDEYGIPVLLVTHDQTLLAATTPTVITIENGTVTTTPP
jgi:molybdate transport system ATP-binding protein